MQMVEGEGGGVGTGEGKGVTTSGNSALDNGDHIFLLTGDSTYAMRVLDKTKCGGSHITRKVYNLHVMIWAEHANQH